MRCSVCLFNIFSKQWNKKLDLRLGHPGVMFILSTFLLVCCCCCCCVRFSLPVFLTLNLFIGLAFALCLPPSQSPSHTFVHIIHMSVYVVCIHSFLCDFYSRYSVHPPILSYQATTKSRFSHNWADSRQTLVFFNLFLEFSTVCRWQREGR